MKFVRALIFVTLGAAPAVAGAQSTEIFKCRDSAGRWMYTNDRKNAERQKCQVVTSQINTVPANKTKPSTTASRELGRFPRETPQQAASAKGRQREILEKELAAEQTALAKARQDLTEQEAVRGGDERNFSRVEERLRPFKDSIQTHEKNIEALRRELSNLR
jgi:septal ring factor EnvC (AmiA/AmiB activator)